MDDCTPCSWPENDVVHKWFAAHRYELAQEVSKYRIEKEREIEVLRDRIICCHEIMSGLYALVNPNDDPDLIVRANEELMDCDCPMESEYSQLGSDLAEMTEDRDFWAETAAAKAGQLMTRQWCVNRL